MAFGALCDRAADHGLVVVRPKEQPERRKAKPAQDNLGARAGTGLRNPRPGDRSKRLLAHKPELQGTVGAREHHSDRYQPQMWRQLGLMQPAHYQAGSA